MTRNTTLSGKPAMSEARRQHVHGNLKSMVEDDTIWQPVYRSMAWTVMTIWFVALLIFAAV